ncbi:sensor domain-containing diguanylate cyclase [Leptospira kirschneri]|uniref:diguanylate cyclase n=1 Tax=Leptospira kirschneri str. 200802841 TaxID=1193047 RepID=A0A828XVH3_9LEPT|nr:sensor domain-containing diguanylate cyclase [Leptospira kirschneri]EMO73962.1 diguanylate cyclase (GGDEF) domain protein [Leptospira kirschneri str. 200801925]EJO68918.1 diguanylate cyclase (GGDEF) domain protein [Leptospira kirschneri serovar Grippotyphosa str. RM52]EKO51365.1 diguanylate cyclase (GGDEF) domain protein [Leptospira kirschneri str. 200802841]EKP06600.1 diguanylate cyclase (GGDEF) domain protein [Leptospira kirschneri str. 2008720114]EKQ82685.1 diguanylate cyclase (GGDEF) do
MNFENEYDLEKLVNNSLDLLTIVDLSGNVLLVNPAFERTLGWKKEDLVGKDPFHLLHPEDKESTYREFEKLNQGLLTLSFQNRYICADGLYRYFSWTASPDLAAGLVYVTGRDITDVIESNRKISQLAVKLKETNDRLFEQASTDPLTKLKNRRMFNEELNNLIHVCNKESLPLSLLMIDADHFKDYNDKFGHIAGDKVLVELASLLTKTFRKKDVLARYGGEEFIAALPNTSEVEANQIAERLVQTVREFSWEKRSVTISVGITTSNSKSINSEYSLNLIEQADKALYCSKVSGRDRITHFSWIQNKKSGSI